MIPSTMILVGSLIILGLAGYWMRRAVKAERALAALDKEVVAVIAVNRDLYGELCDAKSKLRRIISLETPNMAHVGKKAVAIAKGEL